METLAIILILAQSSSAAADSFRIRVLSNRPDKLSGGSALVRIDVPVQAEGAALKDSTTVALNGADITNSFRPGTEPRSYTGLVKGLRLGSNKLTVASKGNESSAIEAELKNHPITGPVFSGKQEQPFICQTSKFVLPDGKLLGPPLDLSCSVKTVVNYVYRSTAPDGGTSLKPLPSKSMWPPDVAVITTRAGERVPYIVRVETGTINRGIYQIAVLHDPALEPEPDAFTPLKGWNKRLLYSFGGGCTEGWFRQGYSTALGLNAVPRDSLADWVLIAGYAYASSSLNVFGNNCQDVTAAETMMMVKEHFIETYGVPRFTFGRGGSGGAYQQIQIGDNYPGLLDGIIPSATFPDVLATIQYLTDAHLLNAYYSTGGTALSDEQKRAIAGVGVLPSVTRISSGAGRINPRTFCPPDLPQELRYHPVKNPSGARCDVFDHAANVYGRDPATGFARRPIDNTGVQYGLTALNKRVITPAQFLHLNEHIGGYDDDGNLVTTRSVADPLALQAAYSTGRVTNGGGGLVTIPILDLRGYLDLTPEGDLHLKYHSFSLRERLLRANGTAANHVLVVAGPGTPGLEEYTISKMDEWLSALGQDTSEDNTLVKIVRARPADLEDSCYSPTNVRITEFQNFSGGECNRLYPTFPSPRMVAGGPISNDNLKCQLKPIDWKDYNVRFSRQEQSRLKDIFPSGVCDWTRPGVAQRKLSGVWLSY